MWYVLGWNMLWRSLDVEFERTMVIANVEGVRSISVRTTEEPMKVSWTMRWKQMHNLTKGGTMEYTPKEQEKNEVKMRQRSYGIYIIYGPEQAISGEFCSCQHCSLEQVLLHLNIFYHCILKPLWPKIPAGMTSAMDILLFIWNFIQNFDGLRTSLKLIPDL